MNQPSMLSSALSESRGVTHVDDLARPSLDADVSVLSEGGTLHAGSFVGIGAIRVRMRWYVDVDQKGKVQVD